MIFNMILFTLNVLFVGIALGADRISGWALLNAFAAGALIGQLVLDWMDGNRPWRNE